MPPNATRPGTGRSEGKPDPMPPSETVHIDLSDVRLAQAPGGQLVTLGAINGVQILVLLRHRH